MDPNNDLPSLATCTTCTFKEDLSNYWTAVLFFRFPNGTLKRVRPLPLRNLSIDMAITGSANSWPVPTGKWWYDRILQSTSGQFKGHRL